MKKVLIIGFVWPEPNSTAAGTRMMQLIAALQNENYLVSFACAASNNPNSFDLKSLAIENFEIELNNTSFDSFIKTLNPSIVLFDRYLTEEQFGWRVTENCPEAIKILDTEDLHFLRHARSIAFKKGIEVSTTVLKNDMAKREIAAIYRCDFSLIISKFEYKLLKKEFQIDKSLLLYLPFLVDKCNLKNIKAYPSFNKRNHFVTMGNFKHEPNWNAVQYLKSTIWPLIRAKLPTAEMHVYGAYATEKVTQLNNPKQGFYIKGWAENIEKTYTSSRVCLAPLLFGAGLKGKLIDAMQYGTPSVTTSIGAEGMHKKLPWNGFICDTPEDFAQKAIELFQNQQTWETAQLNGIEILNQCFDKDKYSKLFIERIQNTQNNLEHHRNNNFIGLMLQHHLLKSTKYMAKWIEAKNN